MQTFDKFQNSFSEIRELGVLWLHHSQIVVLLSASSLGIKPSLSISKKLRKSLEKILFLIHNVKER